MGLDMKDKKKSCGEIARRYLAADKKDRGKLLDEYTATLGYNRDYPDRILKPVKDKGRLRGLSLTKGGTLLRDQIPVRVMFNGDERKPGFFEFDQAAHFPLRGVDRDNGGGGNDVAASSTTKSKTGAT